MATRRTITLSETPNAPTISALCDDRKVNGCYVPLLTSTVLEVHYADLATFEPSGPWSACTVTLDSDDDRIALHDCDLAGCRFGSPHDHGHDDYWPIQGLRNSAWIDGLAWIDPTTDSEV